MNVKTSELTGPALDWAVAKAENPSLTPEDFTTDYGGADWAYCYSVDWAQGGPIIEREDISFRKYHNPDSQAHGKCYAMVCRESGTTIHWKGWGAEVQTGPTPLIAAMRAFVFSKLGDEVEVPDDLLKEKTNGY